MVVRLDNYAFNPAAGPFKRSAAGEKVFVMAKEFIKKAVSPAFLLRRLSMATEPAQKIDMVDHVSTPFAVHMILASDENADVRYALAENHNISRAVLNKLKCDANPYVADRAAKTLLRLSANDVETLSWRSCRTA
jgi:hypothetical protein